jgi:hypothetical protein
MFMSLDDVLDPQEAEQVETVEESVAEETTPEVVEEPKTEEPKTEEETTASKEEKSEEREWTFAAVKDERRKRQELEKELESLKQQQAPKQEMPDVFDDQKAFVDSIRSEYQQQIHSAKLEIARDMMSEAHDDYEEMEAQFIEIAKGNPMLAAEARKASNPAKFAYQQAKKYQEFKDMQDIDTVKSRMREEIRQELLAESQEKKEQKSNVASLTPSLAKARASEKDKTEKVTLDDLFG